jgi:hypothetical protein
MNSVFPPIKPSLFQFDESSLTDLNKSLTLARRELGSLHGVHIVV